jgi:hypothetical protein
LNNVKCFSKKIKKNHKKILPADSPAPIHPADGLRSKVRDCPQAAAGRQPMIQSADAA